MLHGFHSIIIAIDEFYTFDLPDDDSHTLWCSINIDYINQIVREYDSAGTEIWCVILAGAEDYIDDVFMTQEKAEEYCKLHGHYVHEVVL